MRWGDGIWGVDTWGAVAARTQHPTDAEYCLDISDGKRNTLSNRELLRDYSVASRVRFRLTCRRGQWWADAEIGSRFHEINTLGNAQVQAQKFCEEAVQDLIDDRELLAITVTEIREDPIRGTLEAAVVLDVPEGETINLGLIPIGA